MLKKRGGDVPVGSRGNFIKIRRWDEPICKK